MRTWQHLTSDGVPIGDLFLLINKMEKKEDPNIRKIIGKYMILELLGKG